MRAFTVVAYALAPALALAATSTIVPYDIKEGQATCTAFDGHAMTWIVMVNPPRAAGATEPEYAGGFCQSLYTTLDQSPTVTWDANDRNNDFDVDGANPATNNLPNWCRPLAVTSNAQTALRWGGYEIRIMLTGGDATNGDKLSDLLKSALQPLGAITLEAACPTQTPSSSKVKRDFIA